MDGNAEPPEQPDDLRCIARRARTIASALAEPDKSRILSYAEALEEWAAQLEGVPAV